MRARARPGGWRRIRVVARAEFRLAVESRWLFSFAALFAAGVLGLSWFGLAPSGEIGFTSLARITLSLLNLVLFVVPLVGLMLGVMSVAANADSLASLLAQPVSRGEVLAGKYLGLAGALAAAQAVGLGVGGMVVALQTDGAALGGFAVLCLVSLSLGALSVACALAIASVWPDRLRATGAALALWLLMTVFYDLAVFGAVAAFRGLPLQSVLLPALLLNPVDLSRVLVTLAVGQGALFGPTSAVLMRWAGSAGGIAIAASALILQTLLPLGLAAWVFRRRDW